MFRRQLYYNTKCKGPGSVFRHQPDHSLFSTCIGEGRDCHMLLVVCHIKHLHANYIL